LRSPRPSTYRHQKRENDRYGGNTSHISAEILDISRPDLVLLRHLIQLLSQLTSATDRDGLPDRISCFTLVLILDMVVGTFSLIYASLFCTTTLHLRFQLDSYPDFRTYSDVNFHPHPHTHPYTTSTSGSTTNTIPHCVLCQPHSPILSADNRIPHAVAIVVNPSAKCKCQHMRQAAFPSGNSPAHWPTSTSQDETVNTSS